MIKDYIDFPTFDTPTTKTEAYRQEIIKCKWYVDNASRLIKDGIFTNADKQYYIQRINSIEIDLMGCDY